MKGSYVLIIKIDRDRNLRIGKLGTVGFKKGYYAYVGSALNGLNGRIRRHISNRKSLHWHVDYLLKEGKITDVYVKSAEEKEECDIADLLSLRFQSIKNFGSSDCKCRGHLFFSTNKKELINTIISIGMVRFEFFKPSTL